MKMSEALSKVREEKGLKITDLHDKIKSIFGDRAMSYRSLLRILYGDTGGRAITIHQICIALGIDQLQLKLLMNEGKMVTKYLKRSLRKKRYIYNEKAFADILSEPERKFFITEITLKPKGITKFEKSAQKKEISEKWVYGVRSIVTVHLNDEIFKVKKGDCIAFDGSVAHAIENRTVRKAQCLVIQSQSQTDL